MMNAPQTTVLKQAEPVTRIEPARGAAFILRAGERLHVIDPLGEQVADLMCFALGDDDRATAEVLSSGRSIDYNNRLYLSTGNDLWSNRSRKMLSIKHDDVGRHDFTLTPCSAEMYRLLYEQPDHASCFANLAQTLREYGVDPDRMATTFNIFMNVTFQPVDAERPGEMSIGTPLSMPGDRIVFQAHMDLALGLTACASETTNNGLLKPIDYRIEPA